MTNFFTLRCVPLILFPLALRADMVELRDGKRVHGTILNEAVDHIEIQVGANPEGTIRRVLVIDFTEIKTWKQESRRTGTGEAPEEDVIQATVGTEYIERLLRRAENEVTELNFDEAIQQFEFASDEAVRNLKDLEPAEKAEALDMQVHALKLLLIALEQKRVFLTDTAEGMGDRLEERQNQLAREWGALQQEKKDLEKKDGEMRELGGYRKNEELAQRAESIRYEINRLKKKKELSRRYARELEGEQAKNDAKIRLVAERLERAEDEAKDAERAARRR